MSHTVLVVDDEQDICELVKDILDDEGYSVIVAINGEEARKAKIEHQPDCILLDIWMPDIDGISLLREWSEQENGELECPVIMMSGHGMVEHAVEATRLGAYDFLEKPLTLGKLLLMIERALENENQKKLRQNATKVLRIVKEPVGKSEKMQLLREEIKKVAKFSNTSVLFIGEPGVGKLIFARYVHAMSDRKKQPFIEVQAAALTKENLIVSFLGHERDGVIAAGFFEKAENGTIYIQNVEYLEPEVQNLLSSILMMKEFTRLGGRSSVKMTSRILASTGADLRVMVAEAKFNESLFYQLNVVPIHILPLRDHLEDVPELLGFYVDHLVEEGLPYRHFSVAAQNRLRNYQWPGNISELKNLVKRLLILDNKKEISLLEIEEAFQELEQPKNISFQGNIPLELTLRDARELFEKAYLLAQFQECEGNVAKLAEKSGMERTNLYRKLKILGIDPKKMLNDD